MGLKSYLLAISTCVPINVKILKMRRKVKANIKCKRSASREVANLTKRKNPHTSGYGVKEFVRLSFTKDYLIFHLTRTKNH